MLHTPAYFSSTALIWSLLLVFFFPSTVYGQFDTWQTHTSFRQVVDLTASEEAIWAATQGGVFRYGISSGEISRYTTTEGLTGLNITAISYDATHDAVWVGYDDGVLDRIDVQASTVRSFLDIPRASQFPERDIRKLVTTGDTLVVATGFGIVLFDTDRGEVIETFSRFGTNISVGSVTDVTITSAPDEVRRLWVTISPTSLTGDGDKAVASAPLDAGNLQDPLAWNVETVGIGSINLNSIAEFGNTIYVGTENGLYMREDIDTYQRLDVTSGNVFSLLSLSDQLIAIESQVLSAVRPEGNRRVGSGGLFFLKALIEGPDGNLWAGDLVEGVTSFAPLSATESTPTLVRESFFPQGPFDGRFSMLEFDAAGDLWLGGIQGAEQGFYRLDQDGNWTNYIKRFFDELQGRFTRFEVIHTDSQMNVWAGSFGSGLARVDPDGELSFFDDSNSPITGTQGIADTSFELVRGISSESDGSLWVSNTGALRPLHLRLLDGSWHSFFGALGSTLTYDLLFVDSFRQKWIVVVRQNNRENRVGLLVLDSGDDITDASDDAFQYFSEEGSNGQGLPSPHVNGLAEDQSGRIWVATNEGLAYFVNTGIVALDQGAVAIWPRRTSRQPGESQFLLFGLKINAITVDPANKLWVGTDIGAFYIQDTGQGFEVETQLTTQNSPLLSNVILSIAVDEKTGEVYFSTDQGLISVKGESIAAANDVQDLFIYPNPVRVQEQGDPNIIIEGLLDETSIRIMTASGSLVTRLEARGGRVSWNGRDLNNQLVPSGMYIVAAIDQNGSDTAYGKIAVIR